MTYANTIAQQLEIRPFQVTAVSDLLEEGNTIPFIARYRKEKTGSLDDEQIRQVSDLLTKLRNLDDRRATILNAIREQGNLTPDLASAIQQAQSLTVLEDLYQPYKPKRRTRAIMAQEKGLSDLADHIHQQTRTNQSVDQIARRFLNDEVPTVEAGLAGARDIVAERISDHPHVRQVLREKAQQYATLRVRKINKAVDERDVYQLYYEFDSRLDRLRPHQILAINRGESEKILRVSLEIPDRDWLLAIRTQFRPDRRSPFNDQLQMAMEDAAVRLLNPAIERDIRRSLTETAETHAIQVFAQNLRGLLNQPPLANQTILAIDPAYRTGCKLAVLDPTGKLLTTDTIYPHQPQNRREEALKTINELITRHGITLIAIGNGTASRETEQLIAGLTRTLASVHYLMVNEAGASVYSASALARQEFPDLDVSLRGAVSIGRRVQDPLAELVKIDPKSIGIGLYQHDVNQKQLSETLTGVVESVVNQVGVNLNTASPALLTYISGIGPKLAENMVAFREENGRFTNRKQLQQVSGLGPKSFEQSAGFLRIPEGSNPLDASAIHPESYEIAIQLLKMADLPLTTPLEKREKALSQLQAHTPIGELARQMQTGIPTLTDILEQLVRPGRDPREDLPAPILRSDVLSMDDLAEGMRLNGTVRNVVDFGAFVDIGVKQDGLLHRSQIPRGVSLTVGDVIAVSILSIDRERNRIGLGWDEG